MKKYITILIAVATMAIGFIIGNKTAEPKIVEVVPDDYINVTEAVPLVDISCKFTNQYGYICLELGDIGNQFDDPKQESYEDILKNVEDVTEEYKKDVLDLETVEGFEIKNTDFQSMSQRNY